MGEGTKGRFSTSHWTAPSRLSNLEENQGLRNVEPRKSQGTQEMGRRPRARKRGAWKGSPGVGRKTGLGNGEEGAG